MDAFSKYRYLAVGALGIVSLLVTVASTTPRAEAQSAQNGSDVSVSIQADRATVKAGQDVTYTVTMTNLGPQDATFVDVALELPDSLRVVSITCDQGVSPDGPFCEYSSLPYGATLISTVVATPDGSVRGSHNVTTSASISFENYDAFDPDGNNNSASVQTKLIGRLSHP